jgi:hypothetical protein
MRLALVLTLLAGEAWSRCAPGTVGLWSFEQDFNDICGTYNALSINGTALYVSANPPPQHRAFSLSGTAADATMPLAFVTAMSGLVPWTIQAWSWRQATLVDNNYLYGSALVAAYGPFLQFGNSVGDMIRFGTRVSGTSLDYTPADLRGAWHHIAGVGAASNSRLLYLDNALVTSDAGNGTHDTVDTIYIGRFGTVDTSLSSFFDQLRISNLALSAFPTIDPSGSASSFIGNGPRLYPSHLTIR